MSWLLNNIKGALGLGAKPPGGDKGGDKKEAGDEQERPEKKHKATEEGADDANEVPACFPDDVPFDENPCIGCMEPCSTHKQIPDYLKIDTESPLLGSIKPYRRHVLFQTPGQPSNWAPKLDEQEGSLASELAAGAKAAGSQLGYRIIVTAVDTQGQAESGALQLLRPDEALVLPDMVALGPLTPENGRRALEEFLVTAKAAEGTAARQLGAWKQPEAGTAAAAGPDAAGAAGAAAEEEGREEGGGGPAACILVCAHKLRDKRCGVAGPMIVDELRSVCRQKGLLGKVAVLPCSHVGGHKFAGNLVVYGAQGGHWYGRVKPCHAEALLETHVMGGKVIKELWRGRMEE